MTDVAVAVEVLGNLLAAVALAVGISRGWKTLLKRIPALSWGLPALMVFALSNVFYGMAYFGRTTGRFEWWGTEVEQVVRALQISTTYVVPGSLLFAAKTLVREEPSVVDRL